MPKDWQELHLGEVIQAALQSGLYVDSVLFPSESCLDIGTPEDLVLTLREGLEAAARPQARS